MSLCRYILIMMLLLTIIIIIIIVISVFLGRNIVISMLL